MPEGSEQLAAGIGGEKKRRRRLPGCKRLEKEVRKNECGRGETKATRSTARGYRFRHLARLKGGPGKKKSIRKRGEGKVAPETARVLDKSRQRPDKGPDGKVGH